MNCIDTFYLFQSKAMLSRISSFYTEHYVMIRLSIGYTLFRILIFCLLLCQSVVGQVSSNKLSIEEIKNLLCHRNSSQQVQFSKEIDTPQMIMPLSNRGGGAFSKFEFVTSKNPNGLINSFNSSNNCFGRWRNSWPFESIKCLSW